MHINISTIKTQLQPELLALSVYCVHGDSANRKVNLYF